MKKLFKLEENGTTLYTEIRAGLTTFVAMAYIIFLNPVFLSATGMNASGVLAATCLSAALGTALSAFFSNKPFFLFHYRRHLGWFHFLSYLQTGCPKVPGAEYPDSCHLPDFHPVFLL